MKTTLKVKKIINILYSIASKNNFDYWCNDILEYNKTLDYTTLCQANSILQAILQGNRNINEFKI